MDEKLKITKVLRKINLVTILILVLLIFSSLFIHYESSWKYLPVFKYHLLNTDQDITVFVHAFMFGVNLGFFFQLFVLAFSFMIYFSIKRAVSFHLLYSILILRSVLILIQSNIEPENYIAKNGDYSVAMAHSFYLIFFVLLFALNSIYDNKKRPRVPEPYEIIKD